MNEPRETLRQNTEQQRGKQAWEDILEIKKLEDKEQKEYRSQARSLNAMIQINSLGQTLGFLKAKGKNAKGQRNAHAYLLSHLTHWMHGHFDQTIADVTSSDYDGLLRWVTNTASSADYRRATTECLAFGTWLRRFAEAELKEPDAGEE
jgi:CRISPR-associated protein Cmr5